MYFSDHKNKNKNNLSDKECIRGNVMKLGGSVIFTRDQISALTSRGLALLYFPPVLETIYQQQYRQEAAYEFRYRAPIIFVLYGFLSFGIYQILPPTQVQEWLMYHSWVGVVISLAWLLSFFKACDRYFDYYVFIGSTLAIAITFVMITTLENGQNQVLLHAAMMYAVVIIYGFVGLRFYAATLAGWLGGLIGFVIGLYYHIDIEWTLLNRTYTFSGFLGMALAYAIDRQHRENYLQYCIIELNKQELTDKAEQLAKLSRHDALTGLANRRYLDEVLNTEWHRAIRQQTPLCIMMVDIDYFKHYNDTLGHQEGDTCLQKIAEILSRLTSRSGEVAARYGGEEFLLIFPSTTIVQATILAGRLMQLVQESAIPHPKSDISQYVTISAGVATLIPTDEDTIFNFIERADHALYTAKISGRNRYHIAD